MTRCCRILSCSYEIRQPWHGFLPHFRFILITRKARRGLLPRFLQCNMIRHTVCRIFYCGWLSGKQCGDLWEIGFVYAGKWDFSCFDCRIFYLWWKSGARLCLSCRRSLFFGLFGRGACKAQVSQSSVAVEGSHGATTGRWWQSVKRGRQPWEVGVATNLCRNLSNKKTFTWEVVIV